MGLMPKPTKRPVGVMLDPDVLAFLAAQAGDDGTSRSWLINYIIRHYAQQLAAKRKEAATQLEARISF